MANNYHSQPFNGMPFPHPPSQMHQQQQPPPDPYVHAQGGPASQDVSQPPTPSAFQHIPGFHPVAPASQATNNYLYSQNTQQPPWPPASWPTDPTSFFAMMQNAYPGAQFPPARPPGLSFPPPPQSLPRTPQLPDTPTAFAPQPIQPLATASGRLQELMESDAEDGEVSDGELVPPPTNISYSRRATQLSRSMPQSSRPALSEEAYNPDQPAAGQTVTKAAMQKLLPKPAQQQPSPSPMATLQQQRDQAKQFIKLLHSNNMGYRTLASESLDVDLLRDLYSSLNLPSAPAPIAPPKAKIPSHQPASTAQPAQSKVLPPVTTTANIADPVKSAPSPVDRKEYIARLQAAKLAAKQPSAPKADPPQQTSPASAAPPVEPVKASQSATIPSAKPVVTDEQRARTTELIKQRLEALKAKGQPTSLGTAANNVGSIQSEITASPSATQVNTSKSHTPSFPGIPGLFMNTAPVATNTAIAPAAHSTIPQKRSTQSDSTGASTPRGSVTSYTRPLGESPNTYQEESMIIEVSEDESNGSEMDMDDDQTQTAAVVKTPSADRRYPGIIPDFPSRPGSAFPGSSAASTPGPQTPASQVREDELKRKENQLAAMKAKLRQKIADRIAKEKADKAVAGLAQAPAPAHTTAAITPIKALSSVSDDANELIRDVKRRRRAEIETELPTMDAELASNQEKMAKLAQELEALRTLNEKIAIDKQRLADELESLGIDTDGMSHAEMRGVRKEIIENGTVEGVTDSLSGIPAPSRNDLLVSSTSIAASEHENKGINGSTSPGAGSTLPASLSAGIPGLLPGLSQYSQPVDDANARPSRISIVDEPVVAEEPTTLAETAEARDVLHLSPASGNNTVPTNIESPKGPASVLQKDSASAPEDDDDFYSPPPPETFADEGDFAKVVGNSQAQTEVELQAETAEVLSEEGEVEMSESSDDGEEEYEPEESASSMQISQQEAQDPESTIVQSGAASDVSTEDEEAYEPPDVDVDMSDGQRFTGEEEDVSLAESHVEAEDGAMDIASSSSDSSSDSDSDEESNVETRVTDSISVHHTGQANTNVAGDLAPDLQPGFRTVAPPVNEAGEVTEEEEKIRFTPYESPLRMFKSYRYHPNFAQEVAGGFMSPTFSHKIDDTTPFCHYETAGGSCNDSECPYQHFRVIDISGEQLLVQLGTANPGKTPQEKQQWNDGLRGVLKELRKKSIKDPNCIAAEIANYRRQFLDDDTRVVNL